jgi:hypothetical protein
MQRSAIIVALLAAGPAGAQVTPGYTYGRGPDGQAFCRCYGRTGDPANGGGRPFWFQQAPDDRSDIAPIGDCFAP